ncbi:MAG: VOC family protein, partial [Neisseria mucosa]|nr:VOC family protein [Neisseria mucosa]
CPDCAETAEKAVAAGGKLLQEKFRIANGFAAFIEDTEGNRIGLHSTR